MEKHRYSFSGTIAAAVFATFLSASCSSTTTPPQAPPVERDGGIGAGVEDVPLDLRLKQDTPDTLSLDTACIHLGDIPGVYLVSADPSQTISSVNILEGPCSTNGGSIDFYYWERGYSCPLAGDSVTCSAEVFSRQGTSAIVQVIFNAVPLTQTMLHWQPTTNGQVRFPGVDGGDGN